MRRASPLAAAAAAPSQESRHGFAKVQHQLRETSAHVIESSTRMFAVEYGSRDFRRLEEENRGHEQREEDLTQAVEQFRHDDIGSLQVRQALQRAPSNTH
jgi:hypothetical protein